MSRRKILKQRNRSPNELLCYAIAAKRYALFNRGANGRTTIRKYSEHGLGHLLNPIDPEEESRDWIRQIWEMIIADAYGAKLARPAWMSRPAISRISATTPDLVLRLQDHGKAANYADQIKPMNFLITAHLAPLQTPAGPSAATFQLIAPYSRDPRRWGSMTWTDYYSGRRYAITTSGDTSGGVVRVKSYADVFEEYRSHPEPKSLGPDGEPCGAATVGELGRRTVFGIYPIYMGKESNRLEEVEQGTVHDWEEVRSEYHDPNADPWRTLVVPILRTMNRKDLARRAGVTERHIARLRSLREMPSLKLRERLVQYAADHSRGHLGEDAPREDLAVCAVYLRQKHF
jgi:hypothetical protein